MHCMIDSICTDCKFHNIYNILYILYYEIYAEFYVIKCNICAIVISTKIAIDMKNGQMKSVEKKCFTFHNNYKLKNFP